MPEQSTQIEKTAALETSIEELQNTKKAMLNLLEDAHIAEQKEKQRAEELRAAVDEIKRFASIADQERATYLLLLSSIGEGVLVLDLEHKISILNDAGERILGFPKEELIGKHFEEALHFFDKQNTPLDHKIWEEAFVAWESKALPTEISVKRKDGTLLPIAIIISPIIDSKRYELKGVIITFRDVREERTLEDARVNFISIASHQLRTPLTSMRWFSEMLLGGDAGDITEDQKHFIERIYQGTDRMIALVNLLLQIARVEAGRLKVEPVPTDLKAITEAVILTLNTQLKEKTQQVIIKAGEGLPLIPMEQDYLWQIIQNFLTNAIRYSPEKGVIEVIIEKKDEWIEYSVKDSGIGIPENQKDKIFEKFFRADNALKAVPEGSGLGLSLVKSLVEGWKGKIWFDSVEGKGTTFHITIPVKGMEAHEGEVKLSV